MFMRYLLIDPERCVNSSVVKLNSKPDSKRSLIIRRIELPNIEL